MTKETLDAIRWYVTHANAASGTRVLLEAYDAEVARAERAEALLRKLEWAGMEWDRAGGTRRCPWCETVGGYPGGSGEHRPGCELAAIIGAKC